MAITFVEALSGEANNGGNVTLNFVSAQAGDLAVVMGGHADTAINAGVSTAGYTEIVDTVAGVRFSISHKFLTSDTSVTCLGTGSGSDETSYVCFVFRGVNTTTPIDTTSTSASGSAGYPNSPSITTTTDNCVVISCFLLNENHSISVGPTGYSNATAPNTASDTNEITAGAAWKTITTAGAENPGQFLLSGSVPSHSWRAYSVALRASAFGDGALSATGTAAVSFAKSSGFDAKYAATGSGTASFTGASFSNQPVPFSMTGRANIDFSGAISNGGAASMTGVATAIFVGDTSEMESVREDIRSRGAATVSFS